MRSLLKTAGSLVLHRTGIDRLKGAWDGFAALPVVLGYHRVVPDFASEAQRSIPAMLISTGTFERHLDWLARRYDFVSIDDLARAAACGSGFAHPAVAITLDDGYRDNFEYAFPILRDRKIPAAIFVASGVIEGEMEFLHDRIYALLCDAFSAWDKVQATMRPILTSCGLPQEGLRRFASAGTPFAALRILLPSLSRDALVRIAQELRRCAGSAQSASEPPGTLTWAMLDEMRRAGIVIGSHTCAHVVLTNEHPSLVREELEKSRRILESRLKVAVRHFSYPDGGFDRAAVRAVAAAGYCTACTTCRHRDSQYPALTLPRRLLWERSCAGAGGGFSGDVMGCHLNGVFDFLGACDYDHGPASENVQVGESLAMKE